MSILTFSDTPILRAEITMPENGRWFAQIEATAEEVPDGTTAMLTSYDGALSLVATLLRGKMVADRFTAVLVGGRGGIDKPVTSQGYRSATAQIIADGICAEVGEQLAPSPTLPFTSLTSWTRPAGTARAALDSLSKAIGVPWRINALGLVEFSEVLYLPADDENAVELDRNEARGALTLAVEVPRLLPGTTIREVKAVSVVHEIGDQVLTTVFYASIDRVRAAFDRLVLRALPRLDLFARYEAKVISQAADDTLDLAPIDERIPGLSRVPIRSFGPGVRVLVSPGSRVMLGWDGADPSRPYCEAFDPKVGTTTAFELKSPSIKLGVPESAELVALAAKVDANFAAITDAIENWAVVAGDGGAAGKTILSDACGGFVSVAATNVKVS
jgi:hypothetical protein